LWASATVDYSVDAERYGEALKRLEKAKGSLSSPVHRELLELFIYDVITKNHSPYDVYTKISSSHLFTSPSSRSFGFLFSM